MISRICLVLVLWGGCLYAKPTYRNSSFLTFSQKAVDFGAIEAGENKVHRFEYANKGSDVLHLTGVHTPCGCTKVEVSKSILQPGEAGYLEVAFNSAGFSGKVLKTIVVMSDDKLLPNQVLSVKAIVRKEMWFEPSAIDFGDVNIHQSSTFPVTLISKKAGELKPSNLKFDKTLFKVDVTQRLENRIRMQINFLPNRLGVGKQVLSYEQGDLTILLPIKYKAVSLTKWTPNYVEFGSVKEKKIVRRVVTLNNMPERLTTEMLKLDVQVNGKKIMNLDQLLEIDLKPLGKSSYRLEIKLKHEGSELSGGLLGRISVRSKLPSGVKPAQLKFYGFLI